MKIRAGLVGYGLGGRVFHAPLISAVDGLELAAVATSRAAEVCSAYPQVQVTDAQQLIADHSIDLVVISTPNETHFPLAQAALLAGKHVVVDKPLTTTSAEAATLATLATERGLMLCPFLNRRWDGDFLTVKRLIDEGTLGDVALYEARWDRFRPEVKLTWREDDRPGSGLLADLGPHLIDQALVLFGVPDEISADIATQRPGARADDYFELTLAYDNRRVILSASLLAAAARPRFAVRGTLGAFVKRDLDPQEQWLKDGGAPGLHQESALSFGTLSCDSREEAVATQKGDYREFYMGVEGCIAKGGPPPVSIDDAIMGLKLIELARTCDELGRRFPTT